ncbi:MAG TPA: protein phosphatase 2C domain-containing protein [Anaerolineae bacterium]
MVDVLVSLISAPGSPNRVNEDGWAIVQDPTPPGWVAAAVIDGASVRALLPSLRAYLDKQGAEECSPTVWATAIVRQAFYNAFTKQPPSPPFEALLAANRALRSASEGAPGMVELFEQLERPLSRPLAEIFQPGSQPLATELSQLFTKLFPKQWGQLDSRYLRLVLPVCVTTVVRLNLSTAQFEFAHAGDTLLLKVTATGQVHHLSQDQVGPYDQMALDIAVQARHSNNRLTSVAQAIELAPAAREINRLNGVRHNYVDEIGQPRPTQGCGVVNGLDAIRAHIQTGTGSLSSGDRLYLMSDGFALPLSSPSEKPSSSLNESLSRWQDALLAGDVDALQEHLQEITEADASRNIFPRFKHRDDATALMILTL